MQKFQALILGAGAVGLLLADAACIIGFKVETSTSATAGDDDSQGSQGATAASTGESASATTGEGSGTTTTGEATTDAATTTDGATTDATTTTTGATGETTETGGAGECEIDSECALASDCCACAALPVGEAPPACMETCDVTRCEAIGSAGAICRFGACMPQRVACDDSKIVCDQPPPACGAGELPVVDPEGICYTGACAPAALCDRVPECALCPADRMCVTYVTLEGSTHACEPIPPLCDGAPTCACASGYACDAVYNQCSEAGSEIVCSCVDC